MTFVRDHTTGTSASGTAVTATLAANVAAGNLLLVWAAMDNTGTTTPTVNSIDKPGGESATWARVASHDASSATSAAAVRGELWAIKTTVQWPSGTVITATLSASPPKSHLLCQEHDGTLASLRGTSGTGTSTAGTPSAATSGTALQAGDLVVGAATGETSATPSGDTDTTNGSWSTALTGNTGGGASAAQVSSILQHKYVTAAGVQTYNPVSVGTVDSGAAVASFQYDPAKTLAESGAGTESMLTDPAFKTLTDSAAATDTLTRPLSAVNTLDGGTDQTTVTAGNSGGASGDPFDSVTPGTSAIVRYSAAQAHSDGLAVEFATAGTATVPSVQWTTTIGTQAEVWMRLYVYFTANPAAAHRILHVHDAAGTGQRASLQVSTAGRLQMLNSVGSTVAEDLSAQSIALNAWNRIEAHFVLDATVGRMECRLYKTDPDAAIGAFDEEVAPGTNKNTGGAGGTYRFGVTGTGVANVVSWWADDLAVSNGGWIGPAVTVTPITLPDAAAAAEQVLVAADVPLADAGVGGGVLLVAASVPLADSGAATESLQVDTGTTPKTLTDTGTATDILAVTAAVPFPESGAAADRLTPTAAALLPDSATAGDLLTTAATVTLTDSGTAGDILRPAAAVPLTQAAAAADTLTVDTGAAAKTLTDAGAAADTVGVGKLLHTIVGAATTSGFTVSTRTSGVTSLRLKVSTTADLATSPVFSSAATPDADGYAQPAVAGLTGGTYFYGVEMDGAGPGTASGQALVLTATGSLSFVFASCHEDAGLTTDSDAWSRALARNPDLAFSNGDFGYWDITTNTPATFRSNINALVAFPNVGAMLRAVNFVPLPSDHDFDGNNGNGTAASNPAFNLTYRQIFPHYPLEQATTGVHRAFTWPLASGVDVRFVVTDERSFKSPQANTDDAAKTVLGTTQKQWFKDQISNATEPLIFWVGDIPWIAATTAGDDEWSGYNTERTELAAHILGSGKRVIRLAGDMHALAADDGRNSAGRIPVFHAAPWRNAGSQKGGPYTQGPFPADTSAVRQYGHVTVTRIGSGNKVTYIGYDTSDVARVQMVLPELTDSAAASDSLQVQQGGAPQLTDTGSAADTLRPTVAVSFPDVGAAADSLRPVAAVPLAAVGGVAADSLSVQTGLGGAVEVGAVRWAAAVAPTAKTLSDSGAATDRVTVAAQVTLTDSGQGSPTGAGDLYVDEYGAFAGGGSGGDTLTVAAQTIPTDTGTAADSLQVNQGVPKTLTDAGTAADTVTTVVAAALADQGAAADQLQIAAQFTLGDAGLAADSLQVSQAAQVTLTDSGTTGGTLTVAAAVSLVDSGAGAEQATATAAVLLSQQGQATDTLQTTQAGAPNLFDQGIAADTVQVAAQPTLVDSGAAADSLTLAQTHPLPEQGTAADSLTSAQFVPVTLADSATASDQVLAAATVTLTDSGTAGNVLTVTAAATLPDSGIGVDSPGGVTQAKLLGDQAAAADSLTVGQVRVLGDQATAADRLVPLATLFLADGATTTDAIALAAVGALSDHATASDRLVVAFIARYLRTSSREPQVAGTVSREAAVTGTSSREADLVTVSREEGTQ